MTEAPGIGTRHCPQCGAPVPDGDDFCGNCGTYLGWVEEPEPGASPLAPTLEPVPPGRPVLRRPLPTASARDAVVGPPCPACGTANPPDRRFCRRCAAALRTTAREAAGPRRPRRRWGGDTSRLLRRLAALLAVAALVVAAVLLEPWITRWLDDLRDRTATPVAVAPSTAKATAEVPGHPASDAVDGLSNRYWGAPAVGDAVEFAFASPFRLLSVVVHTGAGVQPEAFAGQGRATAVDAVVTSVDGTHRTVPLSLGDRSGPQRTDTAISDVVRVQLVVKQAAGLPPGGHVALGEVEFFRRP
ncbi:zinc ribbon domain-containing protein [Saccharothrix yanglingensis]|uniref:zinc ribbon domain-containing protein n=1 Tax=Saccharothrix yanglingensis TaxID=659496 RepID=UPI0027D20D09|nr:zinc ribbon domain-containing protein [Saccharothrix yanglingensis]